LAAQSKEDQLRQILYQLQLMEGSVQTLQQRLDVLTSASADLAMSKNSLTELKELKVDSPLLIPVGGGAFIHAKSADLSKVIIGIGADVSVEMDLDKTLETISGRLTDVEKAQVSVQEQLSQILNQMQVYQSVGQRLSAELQGVTA
jgi:prefoldin alpha subunit